MNDELHVKSQKEIAMNQNIISYDPSTGEILGEVKRATVAEIEEVVGNAQEAATNWRKYSLEDRLSCIEKAYSAAETSLNRLAELLSREMGKDIRRSTSEAQGSIWGGPYIAKSSLDIFLS